MVMSLSPVKFCQRLMGRKKVGKAAGVPTGGATQRKALETINRPWKVGLAGSRREKAVLECSNDLLEICLVLQLSHWLEDQGPLAHPQNAA